MTHTVRHSQRKVSIVTLNWNGWPDTVACLDSLARATYPDFDIVVLDNASRDDSVEELRSWAARSRIPTAEYIVGSRSAPPRRARDDPPRPSGLRGLALVISEVNLGFCAGVNVALELAAARSGSDYFLVLNNDTACEPDFLEALVGAAESQDDVGIVGGLISWADQPDTIAWAGSRLSPILNEKRTLENQHVGALDGRGVYETDCVSGCMMLIPTATLSEVGMFDEDLFIWSEDWDLSLRVREAGRRLVVTPQARIQHKGSRSLGRLQPLSYYYSTRNRLLLARKHLSPFWRVLSLIWFALTRPVRFGQFALQGRFDLIRAALDAIKDYLLGRDGKWSKHVG